MYKDISDFRPDYEVAHLASQAFHGNIPQTKKIDPNIAWMAYSHARNPKLGFHLFGRHISQKGLAPYRENYNQAIPNASTGPTVGQLPPNLTGISFSKFDAFNTNFGLVNDIDDGSILLMGGDKWNFTINDTWLLAGVHSKLHFYACSPLKSYNLFDYEYYLTITGRELLGLAIFGYKQETGHSDLGSVFVCDNKAKAEGGRLTDYQLAVSQIKSVTKAWEAMSAAGFNIGN